VYTCTERIYRQKSIFMFPYVVIFYCFFCGGPLVVEALGNCPVCPPLNPALFDAMNVCGLKQHDINSYTHLLLGHLYWVFEEQEANRLVARRRRQ